MRFTGSSFLSWDRDLPITLSTDGHRVLLGTAVDVLSAQPVTPVELSQVTVDNFRYLTMAWSRRWVLIVGNLAMTDIGGLLGLLYTRDSAGRIWASSSGHLLGRQLRLRLQKRPTSIAPASNFHGLQLLLPGQALDLDDGNVQLIDRHPFEHIEGSEDDLLERITEALKSSIAGIAAHVAPRMINVGLSGGADSRRYAALAKAAGLSFECFSFTKPWYASTQADRELPQVIARILDVPFRRIQGQEWSLERHEQWVEHTGDIHPTQVPESNYYYFTRGYWDALGYLPAVIEGQCYELGSNYYYAPFWKLSPDYCATDVGRAGARCSLKEFAQVEEFWSQLEIPVGIDRRDLLFWSFAVGSSYSNLYHESDMWNDAFCPTNCRLIYSLMLSVPASRREGKGFQNRITTEVAPLLAGIPINPPNRFWRRQYDRFVDWYNEIQRAGAAVFLRRRLAGIARRLMQR
jgi:hypothetical protein